MAFSPMIAVVQADAPYKTFKELVEYAKKNPEGINYYSTGPGSSNHLVSELLMKSGGFKMTQVPYKGSAPALTDLLAGVIQVVWEYPVVLKPLIDAGKLRAIGITSDERMPLLPEVPTFVEQGYQGGGLHRLGDHCRAGRQHRSRSSTSSPRPTAPRSTTRRSSSISSDQGAGILQGYSGEKLRKFIDDENAKYKDLIERAGVRAGISRSAHPTIATRRQDFQEKLNEDRSEFLPPRWRRSRSLTGAAAQDYPNTADHAGGAVPAGRPGRHRRTRA